MKPIDCEQVRDSLPDLLSDRLDATQSARLRGHINGCAECRAELSVASAVARTRLPVPAGLEARVAGALPARVSVRPRWTAALAASVAVAVIGGSALLSVIRQPTTVVDSGSPAGEPYVGGFISVDDAFLTGASSLRDLSVKELEQLLSELDL